MCFPSFPRFCGQTFLEADDRTSPCLCVKAYNDWMVDEWCGDSERPPHPADHHPAVGRRARRRRDPPQRRARRAGHLLLARSRRTSACRRSTPASGTRSSRPAPRPASSSTCTSARRRRCRRPRPTRPPAVGSTLTFGNAMSSMVDFLMSGVLVRYPKLTLAYSEGQIGWIPYILERADKVWEENRGWNGVVRHDPRAAVAPTTTARSTAASSTTSTASRPTRSRSAASTTSCSRPTTRTPTAPGRTAEEVGQKLMGHLADDTVRKLVRGNAIRCSASTSQP